MDDEYWAVGTAVGFLVFVGCWIYCIFAYGFLLGVGLGWLPALICGFLAAALWPLIILGVAILGFIALKR